MSTLISADELGLRRPESARSSHAPRPAARSAPSPSVATPLLERLAAWAERQPKHRRVGSHTLFGLTPR